MADLPSDITLRDWFAIQIAVGLVSSGDADAFDEDTVVPQTAYRIADAMLKLRDTDNG